MEKLGSNDSTVPLRTLNIQLLVSKYNSSAKRTRAPWRNGDSREGTWKKQDESGVSCGSRKQEKSEKKITGGMAKGHLNQPKGAPLAEPDIF